MKDYPFLYLMHYLHTLQWSQQLCWLPPQPWWGCFSVHREPPGPPESLSLTAGCRRVGSRFAGPSTPPANYIKVTNEQAWKGKWLVIRDSSGMVHTWSFLPLIVKLLMAHAASFCVPKSPCLEVPRHNRPQIKDQALFSYRVSKLDSESLDSSSRIYFWCHKTDD